jgi:hypothetical protein
VDAEELRISPQASPSHVVRLWEAFPTLALPDDPIAPAVDLDAMRRTLVVHSIACQEAALHGLGHMQRRHPARVGEIIDATFYGECTRERELGRALGF